MLQIHLAGSGRRFVNPHIQGKNITDHVEQFVDAVIVDAVLDGREKAVLAAKSQDVPGIDHGPALDRPVQQILDGRQFRGRLCQFPTLDRQVRGSQATTHLTRHPGRSHGHDGRLFRRRLAVSDGRKYLRYMHVLQLPRPPTRQKMVEMLSRTAERLPQRQRLGTQSFGVRAV